MRVECNFLLGLTVLRGESFDSSREFPYDNDQGANDGDNDDEKFEINPEYMRD